MGYLMLHKMVENASVPGVFLFSEMGCPQSNVKSAPEGQTCRTDNCGPKLTCCPRNWAQVPDFFTYLTRFDGFSAYAFWNDGALNFNMVDTKFGNGMLYDDGKNFFDSAKNVKKAARPVSTAKYPTCATVVNKQDVFSLDDIKSYDDASYPAKECPSSKHMQNMYKV